MIRLNYLKRHLFSCLPFFFLALLLCSASASAQTIYIKNWAILSDNTFWHYTGKGQINSSTDDDFTYTVLAEKRDVLGNGSVMATQIKTIADEPTDDRNGDIDFYYLAGNENLYLYGVHLQNKPDAIAPCDLIFNPPILIGHGTGEQIGNVVVTNSSTTIFGFPATVNASVTYQEFIPVKSTPMGVFRNVLRLIVQVGAEVFGQSYDARSGEFWLVENVGMILQDQNADINDAEIQIIDGGQVAGNHIHPTGNLMIPASALLLGN